MKNYEEPQTPILNIERSPVFILLNLVFTGLLCYLTLYMFINTNPWGFILMIPTAVISFQTLWLFLNPFAHVFANHIEYKQSLLSNKVSYFCDIKKVSKTKTGKLFITYTDDEQEALNLFGIKASHIEILRSEIEKHSSASRAKE